MKKCGFVIRVSTDKQARNPEGSLTNQLQKLQAHIEYKNTVGGEKWIEGGRYILKGVSGKDSFRSPQFARLFDDIKFGNVNTVLCTALDRISRSVKDFLNFFEIINQYNVEFVCLKQNYDTTSPQGKLFITIMMALAEFEREQTSARNRDATLVRAERGLWNGGQLIGYDLDANKKGTLIVNEKEKALVQFVFNTYLNRGSIFTTIKQLNQHGYRTKEYMTQREILHTAKKFAYTSVWRMLTNYAYIGKKEINKRKMTTEQEKLPDNEKYRMVPAVWEPIINEKIFKNVQALLKKNHNEKHNVTKIIRHTYILNSGLLWCDKCGHEMEGICGTGKRGLKYYYYTCKNKDCRFKVPASEIENVVLNMLKELASQKVIIEDMVKTANDKLQKELPRLKHQKTLLQKDLEEVKTSADGIIKRWTSITNDNNNFFLKEKLDQLEKRRKEIESGIQDLEQMIMEIERESLNQDLVMLALNKFSELFDNLKPYQQKDILRLILHRAYLGPTCIKIALYGRPPEIGLFAISQTQSDPRSGISAWGG